jgi:hypothetical protein
LGSIGEKFNLQCQFHVLNILLLFEEVKLIQKGAAIPPQWLKPCGILAV